jgi:hypothetical protein
MISQAHYDRVQGHPRSTRVASQLLLIATKYGSGPTAQRRVGCSNDHPDRTIANGAQTASGPL